MSSVEAPPSVNPAINEHAHGDHHAHGVEKHARYPYHGEEYPGSSGFGIFNPHLIVTPSTMLTSSLPHFPFLNCSHLRPPTKYLSPIIAHSLNKHHPANEYQPGFPVYRRQRANPAPLGK